MGYLLWEPRTSNKPGEGGFLEGVPTKPRGTGGGGEEVFFRELPLWKDAYIHTVPARRRYRQEVLLSMAFRPSAMCSLWPLGSLSCHFYPVNGHFDLMICVYLIQEPGRSQMPGLCLLPHSVPWCFTQGPPHSRRLSMLGPGAFSPSHPSDAELCAPSSALLQHLVHKRQLTLA